MPVLRIALQILPTPLLYKLMLRPEANPIAEYSHHGADEIDICVAHRHSLGNAAYLNNMEDGCRHVGEMSNRYKFAEGWIRHSHVGFCAESSDPLMESLGQDASINPEFDKR
jgi:hypothetical protein